MNTRFGYNYDKCSCCRMFNVGDRFVKKSKHDSFSPELVTVVEVLKTSSGYYYKLDKYNVVFSRDRMLDTNEFLKVI